jgi:uncharacterized protein (TIGR02246 family)
MKLRMPNLRQFAVIGAAAVLITACTAGAPALQSSNAAPWQAPSTGDDAAIRALFDSTAAGWNRGDLAVYMSPYADSAVGAGAGSFDVGKAAIERTMRAGFWRNGRPAQQLHYENIRVRMLGADYALVNGEFVLTGGDRPDRRGLFSTVWARTSEGWRMINDHSG